MFSKRAKLVPMSSVIGLFVAAACLAVSVPLHATDIVWHETSVLKYSSYPDYRREGTAVFKTGEKANVVVNGKAEGSPKEDVGAFKGDWLLRFDDGSSITIHVAGTRGNTTWAGSCSGEFASGTGRYEGITGKVTFVSQVSGSVNEIDWVGSYSLPK
jgi:hypothetical protein